MQKKFSQEWGAICTHGYTNTLLKYLPTYLDKHVVKEEMKQGFNILTREK